MGSFPLLKATGLQTAHNPFSATADGFLQVAKNVVISANHVVEPRRGHRNFPNTYTLANSAVGAFFGDTLLAGTSAALFRDTGTAFASVGAFTPVDDLLLRMKFVEARQNLYFNADDGVRVIRETVETAPVMAGLPTPVISHSALAYPGSTVGLLAPNNQVAIRIVYGYVDGNGNEILSAPSERLVFKRPADIVVPTGNVARASNVVTVTFPDHGFEAYDIADNTDGSLAFSPPEDVVTVVSTSVFTYPQTAGNFVSTVPETFSVGRKDILVRGDLPSELTTDHFVRFYRTEFSGAASAAPGDEMFLVYERQLSETDISNGYFETVLGTSNSGAVLSAQPLYTNARNGEGVLQLNDRPPVAKDIAVFGGRTWYANTTSKHRDRKSVV